MERDYDPEHLDRIADRDERREEDAWEAWYRTAYPERRPMGFCSDEPELDLEYRLAAQYGYGRAAIGEWMPPESEHS